MARVDIRYNRTTNGIDVWVSHKRNRTMVGAFGDSTEAYGAARFLTKVFHEITMDTMNECHKKAIETIERMQHESNDISD